MPGLSSPPTHPKRRHRQGLECSWLSLRVLGELALQNVVGLAQHLAPFAVQPAMVVELGNKCVSASGLTATRHTAWCARLAAVRGPS
jgi:hypothetical protein